jgi:hypothetical protein
MGTEDAIAYRTLEEFPHTPIIRGIPIRERGWVQFTYEKR